MTRDSHLKINWGLRSWLGRRSPSGCQLAVEDIPVMLIKEGDKWVGVAEDKLPVPPPAK